MLTWIAAGLLLTTLGVLWGVWACFGAIDIIRRQNAAALQALTDLQENVRGPEETAAAVWKELERVQDRNRFAPIH